MFSEIVCNTNLVVDVVVLVVVVVSSSSLVTFYVGQKTVLLNNYLYGFNMVSIWFAIYEAGQSPLADYDSTLI